MIAPAARAALQAAIYPLIALKREQGADLWRRSNTQDFTIDL